jgi:hypothetical protein
VTIASALAFTAEGSATIQKVLCNRAVYPIHADSLLHLEVVFRYKITLSFCHNGKRVLRPQATCEAWDIDPVVIVYGGCSVQGYFYGWGGNPNGGYYAQAAATFQNCILHYGCMQSGTITLKIWANANGAWIHGKDS